MQVNVHFLTYKLFAGEFATVECTHLVTHWASHHCELDFYLLTSSLANNLVYVSVEYVADLSYKIIFGIDEAENLSVFAKNA